MIRGKALPLQVGPGSAVEDGKPVEVDPQRRGGPTDRDEDALVCSEGEIRLGHLPRARIGVEDPGMGRARGGRVAS